MYEELLGESGFYRLLLRFDEDLAARTRVLGCWHCGKALHVADFTRKPRGVPAGLGERYNERFSFCCAGRQCRKRRTCPSLRFLSRKVYLATVVVLVSALRSGATPRRVRYLQELVGVSRRTDPALAYLVVGDVHPDTVLACGSGHTAAADRVLATTDLIVGALYRNP
jgi:hypothetical protein